MKGSFVIGCVLTGFLGGLWAAIPALAADSILSPQPGPCAAALDGPDYVPGVDANGQPVARADLGAEHTSVPDQVFIPLLNPGPNQGGRGRGPYAAIDGRRLDPLVNPQACPPAPPTAPKPH